MSKRTNRGGGVEPPLLQFGVVQQGVGVRDVDVLALGTVVQGQQEPQLLVDGGLEPSPGLID
jgi:hypothetical protein